MPSFARARRRSSIDMTDKAVSYASQLAAIERVARAECLKPLRLTRAQEEMLLAHLRAAAETLRELRRAGLR